MSKTEKEKYQEFQKQEEKRKQKKLKQSVPYGTKQLVLHSRITNVLLLLANVTLAMIYLGTHETSMLTRGILGFLSLR